MASGAKARLVPWRPGQWVVITLSVYEARLFQTMHITPLVHEAVNIIMRAHWSSLTEMRLRKA